MDEVITRGQERTISDKELLYQLSSGTIKLPIEKCPSFGGSAKAYVGLAR